LKTYPREREDWTRITDEDTARSTIGSTWSTRGNPAVLLRQQHNHICYGHQNIAWQTKEKKTYEVMAIGGPNIPLSIFIRFIVKMTHCYSMTSRLVHTTGSSGERRVDDRDATLQARAVYPRGPSSYRVRGKQVMALYNDVINNSALPLKTPSSPPLRLRWVPLDGQFCDISTKASIPGSLSRKKLWGMTEAGSMAAILLA